MSFALTILVVWIILLHPLGVGFHHLVLGVNARQQALPLTLLTGLAVSMLALGVWMSLGLDAPDARIPALVLALVVFLLLMWRKASFRGRELLGPGIFVFVLCWMLVAPAWDDLRPGPLGYGTRHEPVVQVGTIRQYVEPTVKRAGELDKRVAAVADRRYHGFEQYAAFTISLGRTDDATSANRWDAYGFYSLIAALFGLLTVLPVAVFAAWRGVGRLGMVAAMLLGVVSPLMMLGLAMGEGALIAVVPFAVGAIVSLLIAKRDRGWLALCALYASVTVTIVGPLGLVPLVAIAGIWSGVGGRIREHLKHTDQPVDWRRPVAGAAVAVVAALVAAWTPLSKLAGMGLRPMFDDLQGSVLAWPFSWIGDDLLPDAPDALLEYLVYLVGPALLAVAIFYGIARREFRELAIVAGVAVSVAVGAVWTLARDEQGAALVEYSWMVGTPLLAVVIVRTIGLARAAASESTSGPLTGTGPAALIAAFGVLSIAAATVSGVRGIKAPAYASALNVPQEERIEIYSQDPWLAYVLDGSVKADRTLRERPQDFDQLDEAGFGGVDAVVVPNDPLGSDPPSRMADGQLIHFAVRVAEVSGCEVAADGGGEDGGEGQPAQGQVTGCEPPRSAREHHPVEDHLGELVQAGGPYGGLLVPQWNPEADPGLAEAQAAEEAGGEDAGTTDPTTDTQQRGDGTAQQGVEADGGIEGAAGAVEDGAAAGQGAAQEQRPAAPARVPRRTGPGDVNCERGMRYTVPSASPVLPAVGCFVVPLSVEATTGKVRSADIVVHLRGVGLVIPPEDPGSQWEGEGWTWRTSADGASIDYDHFALSRNSAFEYTVEGDFGEARLTSAFQPDQVGTPSKTLVRSYSPWSASFLDLPLTGALRIINQNDNRLEVGRLVARPTDIVERFYDAHLAPKVGSTAVHGDPQAPSLELEVMSVGKLPDGAGGQRVGDYATIMVRNYLWVPSDSDLQADRPDTLAKPRGGYYHLLVDWAEGFVDPWQGETTVEVGTSISLGGTTPDESRGDATGGAGATGGSMSHGIP